MFIYLSSQFFSKSPRTIISFLDGIASKVDIEHLEDSIGADGGLYTLPTVKYLF